MRFERLRVRGVIPFPGEVEIDFGKIPGRLVAITGDNGAGKSTLLELLLIAMRQQATRGPLASLATTRATELEVDLVNGKPWRLLQRWDAVGAKGEAQAFDADGAMVLPSTKLRDFEEWARRMLPDPDVLLASTFAAQKSGGLLAMTPGDRKRVILRALGVEKLEVLAADARERARAAKGRLDVADGRLADERRRCPGRVEDAERALEEAREALANAEHDAQTAEGVLQSTRKEAERIAKENAAADARRAEIAAARGARAAVEQRRNGLSSKLVGLRDEVLDQADDIRAAAARVAAVDAEIAPLRETLAELRAEQTAADRALREAGAARDRAAIAYRQARDRVASARARAEACARAAAEAEKLPGEQAKLAQAKADLATAEAKIEELQAIGAKGAEGRITDLREALDWYADGDNYESHPGVEPRTFETAPVVADAGDVACDALNADDDAKKALDRLPSDLAAAREAKKQAQATIEHLRHEIARLERLKASSEASGGDEDLAQAEVDAKAAHDQAEQALSAARAEDERLRRVHAERTSQLQELTAKRRADEALAARASEIAGAEARAAEIETQIAAADAEIQAADERLAALDPNAVPDPVPLPDVAAAERAAKDLGNRVHELRARAGDAERAHTEARAAAARLQELDAERAAAADELADWTRIGHDLGRDGLQAMEVDAVGAEMTAIANDLLHTCVGPRFTVTIDTQRASADGKKMLEGCDIRVFDARDGREKLGEDLSGGEQVIVGTPIRLALAQIACRRWGIEGPTLVLDEVGAALDPGMGPKFISMIRRAADAIGASQVLFVSHDREVQALADARVEVGSGKVRVAA